MIEIVEYLAEAQFCGGIAGITCPDGYECIDDPDDDCDPDNGGADCGGICVMEDESCTGNDECDEGVCILDDTSAASSNVALSDNCQEVSPNCPGVCVDCEDTEDCSPGEKCEDNECIEDDQSGVGMKGGMVGIAFIVALWSWM